jgi:leucyl aminopeptidase
MIGMHRDKCGAAFVAGFFKTLSILKPKGLKVYGTLCFARNSIGEGITRICKRMFLDSSFKFYLILECYVSDEIITARSKKRIRIGNTV